MTVGLVAQPTRGLLLERIGARLIGTVVGALAGGLILAGFFNEHVWLMLALALWVAACAGVGNFFRHFRNYGFVLAGYTATIVALFGIMAPVFDVDLALGRVYGTVIGVLASALFSWAFTDKSPAQESLRTRVDALVLASVSYCLARAIGSQSSPDQRLSGLLEDIAGLTTSSDQLAGGTQLARREARRAREVIDAVIDLLIWSRSIEAQDWRSAYPDLSITDLAAPAVPAVEALIVELDMSDRQSLAGRGLVSRLQCISAALTQARPRSRSVGLWTMLRQQDGFAVWSAALRPLIAMGISSALWWVLDWSDGPIMVMTAVLFASLFSSHNQPDLALKDVLAGSAAGAVLGLACRFWLLPQVTGTWELAGVIAPFLLAGALLMARPATAKMAIDLNMTFLLIAQPGLHTDTDFLHSALQAAAILGGVYTAVFTYRWLVPSSRKRERRRLARRIAQASIRLSVSPDGAVRSALYSRIRMLIGKLISIEKQASALLVATLECAAVAQFISGRNTGDGQCGEHDHSLALSAAARLINTTRL